MGFYVMLVKINEDEQGVIYNFGSDSEHLGKIYLNKKNGKIKEIEPINNENYQHILARAGVKLRQYWKTGNFPLHTCWAS